MSDATTDRRRQFKQHAYKRLAEYGIGDGTQEYKTFAKYELIRHTYRELFGKVQNHHRLSTDEYNGLCKILDIIYPPETKEQANEQTTNIIL